MKKIQFLIDMKEQGKLEIVEPSEEITNSYLDKSDSYLESSKLLFKADKLEESISMSYYSMYYCLISLLFRYGIKSENHSVSVTLLKELFKERDLFEIISFGKKERIDKQYYTDFKITKLDTEDMIKKAEEFTLKCRLLIKNSDKNKIEDIRKELSISLSNY